MIDLQFPKLKVLFPEQFSRQFPQPIPAEIEISQRGKVV